ncbi:MAG: hypothetical protein HKN26_08450 [Acidimicrobiales bacterium]|nr:hypothetical protein [Acidimicrobiales bacterium]
MAKLVATLHARLGTRRRDVLEDRADATRRGRAEGPRDETADIRGGNWLVGPVGSATDQPIVVHTPLDWGVDHATAKVDGTPVASTFVDVAEALTAHRRLPRGAVGPHLALPPVHDHREARLWNDLLCLAEQHLDLPRGSVRTTIAVAPQAEHELDEILYELRDYAQRLTTTDAALAVRVEEANVRRGAGVPRPRAEATAAPLSA